MGFGTLFIGYFFLINVTPYYTYTDVICASVMLLALYKLSRVNKSFFGGMVSTAVFTLLSLAELALLFIGTFISIEQTFITEYLLVALRYTVIFVITVFILRGIYEVATEVDAAPLATRAKASLPLAAVFLLDAAFEMPFAADVIGSFVVYIYFALFVSLIIYIANVLIVIYKAYMQICMPEDLEPKDKKSKFGFMNRYWEHIEEKSKKYAEYKMQSQTSKKKRKKKK